MSNTKKQLNKNNKIDISIFILVGIFFCLLIAPFFIFKYECTYVYKWYIILLTMGIGFFPLTSKIFYNFTDYGYIFSKTLGILFSGVTMFWLSSLKILKFTPINCLIVTSIVIVISVIVSILLDKNKSSQRDISFKQINIKYILFEEIIFISLFIFLLYMKSYQPNAYGTEKFMDYGFMKSMTLTDYFPVEDIWFGNENLNYYYIGQYFAAFLNQVSFNKVEYSYNIMFYTICALSFVLTFSITNKLIETKIQDKYRTRYGIIGGIISGCAVCFMGSCHYLVFGLLKPLWYKLTNQTITDPYWFPQSTRYVGFNPERPDKTITETPSYSFVIGDLHAHVINIMFVLTIIGIIVAFATQIDNKQKKLLPKITKQSFINDYIIKGVTITVILCGFLIGVFQGTNFWDYPIYMVVTGLTLLFVNYRVYGFKKNTTLYSIIQIIYVFVVATLTLLPFKLNFVKMEAGIRLAENHTLFHQLLVLWLFPVACGGVCAYYALKDYFKDKNTHIPKTKNPFKLFGSFITNGNISDLMTMLITCCAIGLIIIPEIIYVKDIYEIDYSRANTTFKLTYQTMIMLGIVTGYAIIKLAIYKRTKIKIAYCTIFSILSIICTMYFVNSCHDWFGNIFDSSRSHTLNALDYLEKDKSFVDDASMIQYIQNNIDGMPVILEATGGSYSRAGRISVTTGKPTVLGWQAHEWLWRFNPDIVSERTNDIAQIYCDDDIEKTKELIEKYDIEYIYVGPLEYETYFNNWQMIKINKLKQLGEVVVYQQSKVMAGRYNFIVKVDRQ